MNQRAVIVASLVGTVLAAFVGLVFATHWDLLLAGEGVVRWGLPLSFALLPTIFVLLTFFVLRKTVYRPAKVLSRDIRALLESPKTDSELALPRRHALEDLPEAVAALAGGLRAARREIRSAMASATAQMDEQKTWLEVILQGLDEGVLVCSRNHQMLLFNQSAVSILGTPEAVGLGRPLFEVIPKAPIEHTLERLERRFEEGAAFKDLSDSFVCANIAGNRSLQGRMALIPDPKGQTSAYLITLVDISADVDTIASVDTVRRAVTVDLRETIGNLRAAAEVVEAHPQMSEELRQRFHEVLRDESEQASDKLEALAQYFRGHALGRYPMADILSVDLLESVNRRLSQEGDPKLIPVGQPLWLMADSLTMVRALECLLRTLAAHTSAASFEVEALLGDRRVYLDFYWRGKGVSNAQLSTWLEMTCGEELGNQSLRDVFERHGLELWSQRRGEGDHCFLRLPMIAPKRIQFATDEGQLPPRPEFYDFGLMREHTGDANLAATPLNELSYVVFDCEMTGLDPVGGDEIISIAGVRMVKGRVLSGETFECVINPGKPIPPASIRFHGITDDQVVGKPSIAEVLPQFRTFVGDSVMVAHNAAFDMKFLSMKEKQTGVAFDNPVLDTLLLSVMLEDDGEDHSLDGLIERYGISIDGRHTALGDAIGTAQLLVRLLERAQSRGFTTFGDVMKRSNMVAELRQRERTIAHSSGNSGPGA